MLPATAVYYFPWELKDVAEGTSVRTFGRLSTYQPEDSKAILSSHHASLKYHVCIQTSYIEPFNPVNGALYIVLGEIESSDEGGVVVKARVMNCVDGVDLALLQKAISDQRAFLQETVDGAGMGNTST